MNLGTTSHGNGVIFHQNPPFFWRHFVDWTKYRSRSSSYYTAQWVCHVVLDDFTTRKYNFHVLSRTSQICASFEKNMRVYAW
jgi:hypothetical protein